MGPDRFEALVVREENGAFVRRIETRRIDDLPEGDLLIKVRYAALNYKDALSAAGHKGVTRRYPHTPGIEAGGVIVASRGDAFKVGEEVIVAGFDLGMNVSGAFAEYIRVPAGWALRPPATMTLREGVICGVAGFTAALSLYKLESAGLEPGGGCVLVTGATGGVGSLAISILARAGYEVAAVTGKADRGDYLRQLGAARILGRAEADDASGRALLQPQWAGVIDSVGGNILATALKSTQYGGSVAACGLVQSADLHTTVYPFILRAVTLFGIDSVHCPEDLRRLLWTRLADAWRPATLEAIAVECRLDALDEKIDLMLEGRLTGRTIVVLD
ncbi:MAG: YhdH/YhfP family quinone oxidoreductase [Phycisphaerae bacterium]|nr:YhdH/YhfP family quinone oxidoreductase [Phycisphaerae bacterium]